MSCQHSQVLAICSPSTCSRELTQHQRCSHWQPGTAHLHHSIPGKENEPGTELKELQFVARECHLKFYSCLMLDTFLWSQLQHIAELINLATVSDTHKFSLFFSGWAVHEMIWVPSNVFVIHKDSQNSLDQHFSACNTLRLMICNPLSMVCDLSSKSNAITSVCHGVTETL